MLPRYLGWLVRYDAPHDGMKNEFPNARGTVIRTVGRRFFGGEKATPGALRLRIGLTRVR